MAAADDGHPHVTLVLGAGGPVGQAFHAGVLGALADACGWDARSAELIVGTSAGAQTGALLRAGWDTKRLTDRVVQLPSQPGAARTSRRWPASTKYLRAVAARPWRMRLGPLLTALLPEGAREGAHLGESFRRLLPRLWPHRPLWIPAVHLDHGSRVVFGKGDAPLVDIHTAVRCSSAVPAVRPPVVIGEDRYVDGGVTSPTHADLGAHAETPHDRHVVVALSPLSRFWPLRLLLRAELRWAVRHGVDVVLFEPDREVMRAMGWNPLDPNRARAVAEAAYQATRRRLARSDAASAVRLLLRGEP